MSTPFLLWRMVRNVFRDGFVHAGNLAYLSLTTIFPLFILIAAIAGALGRTADGQRAVAVFLRTVPLDVAQPLAPAINAVVAGQSAGALTFGAVVALWSVGGFIETLRDLIRRPHGLSGAPAAWKTRLLSLGLALATILLALVAFASQLLLTVALQVVTRLFPLADGMIQWLGLSRLAPPVLLFLSLWGLFRALRPREVRYPTDWPGALVVTTVWMGATLLLPLILGNFANFSLTYGALAGVMVALLFFYVVGFGFVLGAELNATLAQRKSLALQRLPGMRFEGRR